MGNALRLHNYLKARGTEVHINPRVVWAGSGGLVLNKPRVPVWQLARPEYMLKDLQNGRYVADCALKNVSRILELEMAAHQND